ncbi:methyltransferase domain-containing protein [uncultured Desulfosarcina sp.]|uniref:class I SAM-dependent methyltransferase n=1 Tax=uncultured Desulfosarcina sp. TaxID=218289 RepID=UPI0029C80AAF|nr:methyltransferase domain-containing protein [uncultured Desulfosarcina sp.]
MLNPTRIEITAQTKAFIGGAKGTIAVIIATNSGYQKKAGTPCRGKFTEGLLDCEQIFRTLNIKPGLTILDAGCGNGYMSKRFSNQVAPSGKVYAIDRDQYFIKSLHNETRETHIVAMQADITGPTLLNESSVDIIYISTVVHIFSKPQMQGFLREVKRLLKLDALLAIVEIEKKETPFGPPLKQRYSAEELKEIVPLVPIDTVKVGEHFYMQIFQNKENQETTRICYRAKNL